MKILLAEDDYATRKFMVSFLSKYGECDVTVDGMEAVDAFLMALEEEEPYDLVCLDIMMPVMYICLKTASCLRSFKKWFWNRKMQNVLMKKASMKSSEQCIQSKVLLAS